MGLFDTIRCKAIAPGTELLGDRAFETKDLGRRMEQFTIREDGRLIHHRVRRKAGERLWRYMADRDVIVPLHRDITLLGDSADGQCSWYVARFTDGKLEWVKPRESLDEDHQEYLLTGD